MSAASVLAVLMLLAAALVSGCERSWNSEAETRVPLTTAPGLAVPDVEQLSEKLESGLRPGAKVYTREDGKWINMEPAPVGKHFAAVVRSFDAKEGMAYVELTYRDYKMPIVQIWRFDCKTWNATIDPGIFVR
jgi:hypothetical protein